MVEKRAAYILLGRRDRCGQTPGDSPAHCPSGIRCRLYAQTHGLELDDTASVSQSAYTNADGDCTVASKYMTCTLGSWSLEPRILGVATYIGLNNIGAVKGELEVLEIQQRIAVWVLARGLAGSHCRDVRGAWALAIGPGYWLWLLALAIGSGCWLRLLAMAVGDAVGFKMIRCEVEEHANAETKPPQGVSF